MSATTHAAPSPAACQADLHRSPQAVTESSQHWYAMACFFCTHINCAVPRHLEYARRALSIVMDIFACASRAPRTGDRDSPPPLGYVALTYSLRCLRMPMRPDCRSGPSWLGRTSPTHQHVFGVHAHAPVSPPSRSYSQEQPAYPERVVLWYEGSLICALRSRSRPNVPVAVPPQLHCGVRLAPNNASPSAPTAVSL